MAYYKDLRDYLEYLDKVGKLRTVSRPINKDTEMHPLVRWQYLGTPEPDRTGFLFENVTGLGGKKFNCRVATSVMAASRQMYAIGMKCETDKILETWRKAYANPIQPRLVATGPVKEEIHVGDGLLKHGGMDEFAVPFSTNGWESLPRLTAASWHTKDPDTGVINAGTYNGTVLGPLHTSCRAGGTAQVRIHWAKCRQRGVPLPAAVVIGGSPAISYVSVSRVPYGVAEHSIAGGIAGEPIDVVKCETVDLSVPATSEIVLEGELSTEIMEPDAASGEHLGYTIVGGLVYSFKIKAITHRKNPIWHDYISQMPPSESSTLRGIGGEGRWLSLLRDNLGLVNVKDVAFHHCAGAWRLCVIRMQDVAGVRPHNSVVQRALLATLLVDGSFPKMVIAVDEDINPWDLESVFWAMSFRYQPHRDTKIIQGRTSSLDQSVAPYDHTAPLDLDTSYPLSRTGPQGASAILMDATRKWPYTPIALPKKNYMENAKRIWEELGFGPLKASEPWFGISLGVWPKEYQKQAEWAEKGEFQKVADDLLKGTQKVDDKTVY